MTAIDNMQDALRRSRQERSPGNDVAQEEPGQLDQNPITQPTRMTMTPFLAFKRARNKG